MKQRKNRTVGRKRRKAALWLGLLVPAFLAIGLRAYHMNPRISPYDTAGYMEQARDIREMGGAGVWLVRCYTGQYPNANQMPLYILVLSTLRFGSLDTLVWARLLALVLGAGAVVAAFAVAYRLFGLTAAMLASAATACSGVYLYFTTIVACEPLLALWVLLAWAAMVQHLRTGRGAGRMGAWIALAYLTKGTGLLLLPIGLAVCAFRALRRSRQDADGTSESQEQTDPDRPRRGPNAAMRLVRSRSLYLCAGAFLLVSSPVLVRNVVRYRSPFYTVNRAVFWMDTWDQFYSPDPETRHPTLRSYLRTHSLRQIFERMSRGVRQQAMYMLVALRVPALVLTLLALCRREWLSATAPALAIVCVFFCMLAWYPVKDVRFTVPLVPMLLVLASGGADFAFRRAAVMLGKRPERPAAWIVGGLACLVAGSQAIGALRHPRTFCHPVASYRTPPNYFELWDWLGAAVDRDTTWAIGPSHDYEFPWARQLPGRRLKVPWAPSMARLQAWIREHRVRFLVLDRSTLSQRQAAFAGYAEVEGVGVHMLRMPKGWRVTASSPGTPSPVIVFDTGQPPVRTTTP